MDVRIEKLVYGGDGLAHHEGQAVFVSFVLPGEEVSVQAIQPEKKFVRVREARHLRRYAPSVNAEFFLRALQKRWTRCGNCLPADGLPARSTRSKRARTPRMTAFCSTCRLRNSARRPRRSPKRFTGKSPISNPCSCSTGAANGWRCSVLASLPMRPQETATAAVICPSFKSPVFSQVNSWRRFARRLADKWRWICLPAWDCSRCRWPHNSRE